MDDDLWAIVNDCLAESPHDRPKAKDLLARIIEVCSEPPHDLYQYIRDLIPTSSSDDEKEILKEMEVHASEYTLKEITDYGVSKAGLAMGILYRVIKIRVLLFSLLTHGLVFRFSRKPIRENRPVSVTPQFVMTFGLS